MTRLMIARQLGVERIVVQHCITRLQKRGYSWPNLHRQMPKAPPPRFGPHRITLEDDPEHEWPEVDVESIVGDAIKNRHPLEIAWGTSS